LSTDSEIESQSSIGIIGFGAFGRLMAEHLSRHFRLCAYDPRLPPGSVVGTGDVEIAKLAAVASRPILVFATPVEQLDEIIEAARPYLRPGALVFDVGSVKIAPSEIMRRLLPAYVEIVATHPLFGPQSAHDGVKGLKIAVCPIRGMGGFRAAAFMRKVLRLHVILTTPDAHDREAATVQGLTHLIAQALVQMEPLPTRITTKSFDLMMQAANMVRHDAPEVLHAIERANPYSSAVRRRFLDIVASLDAEFAGLSKQE
jgi:prephenate dehydrogenase